jgi:hypothetical protein
MFTCWSVLLILSVGIIVELVTIDEHELKILIVVDVGTHVVVVLLEFLASHVLVFGSSLGRKSNDWVSKGLFFLKKVLCSLFLIL